MTKLSLEAKISWRGAFGNRVAYLTTCRTRAGIKKQVAEFMAHHPSVSDVRVDIYYPEIAGAAGIVGTYKMQHLDMIEVMP